jgi:PAS domain S-box-containing protein
MDGDIKKKILIVDDDKNICRSLSFSFTEEGYSALETYSGSDAIRKVKSFNPDLILLDIILPDMTGMEVCKVIKEDEATRHIPIIMLTAMGDRVTKTDGFGSGADDYISKPYDTFDVLARVKAHLRTKLLYDEVKADERDYAAILEMTKKLTTSLNARDTLSFIVNKMAEITNSSRCSILYIGMNKNVGYVIASSDDINLRQLKIDIAKYPEIKKVLLEGKELIIYDVFSDPLMAQIRDVLKEQNIKAIILFPITFEDEIIGTLILRSLNVEKVFSVREIRLCQLIANVSAGPLKMAFLYETVLSEAQKEKIARMEAEKDAKETHKTLKTITDNIEVGIAVISNSYTVKFVNPFLARLYGKDPSYFIGKKCQEVLKNIEIGQEDCIGAAAMKTGKRFESEMKITAGDGKERYLDVIAYPIRNIEDAIVGFICQMEDITERKLHERKISEYTKKLETVNKSLKEMDMKKTEFLNRIAHDLRTPLTSIKAYSELILKYKDKPAETYTKFLDIIKEESNRMALLINDYLDLMRLTSGKMEYKRGPLNLPETVKQFVAMFSYHAKKNNISIVLNIPERLPILMGDSDKMNWILNHLLTNAVKFTPSGGNITISAKVISVSEAGNKIFVEVSVADTGRGIPSEWRDKIFDRFFQIDDPAIKAKGGTGLGLAIVKEIVEHHNGRVWAEASPSGGADIRFTLPVKE